MRKWCYYCRKDNHNDSECHSTRPADWKPALGDFPPWIWGESGAMNPPVEPCLHSIADARNKVIKSGYVCVKCYAVFAAADHDLPKPPTDEDGDAMRTAIEYGFVVQVNGGSNFNNEEFCCIYDPALKEEYEEVHIGGDKSAALKRAIARAVAAREKDAQP